MYFSDLVDAKVSHSKDNRAGHELSLGALRRRTKRCAGRGIYLACKEKRQMEEYTERTQANQNEKEQIMRVFSSQMKILWAFQKVCITARTCAHTHTHTHHGTWL